MEKTGSKLTDMPDKELIRLALEQNQAAYIVLYTRYNVGVRNHIAKYVSQNEDIEDIYRFSTWLFRIARNTALDHIGRKDREKNNMPVTSINDQLSEIDDIPAPMHNPEEDIIKQQEYDKWIANIDKLKEDYRTVARMNLIDNFGYKEIAETLSLPINTVKTRIRRAKEQLLKMMNISDELQ